MKDLFTYETRHETSIKELRDKVLSAGGNEDTTITIEADGEPVYIYI